MLVKTLLIACIVLMRPVATPVARLVVYAFVSLFVTPSKPGRQKQIEILFGTREITVFYGGAQWRHLANKTERFVRCGDTALCQITLTTCYQST